MADHTVLTASTSTGTVRDFNIPAKDREVLRGLAGEVAELAARPEQDEKRKLWTAHNQLESTRPLIFCDPENGWNEIVTEETLACEHELGREWEVALRKELFWGKEMKDDRVIEPYFNLNYSYSETNWGDLSVEQVGGEDHGAYTWKSPIQDYASDLDKMGLPDIILDMESTNKKLALAEEILGDLLTVRLKGVWWWTLGMTWTLVTLRGLENYMTDFYMYPDELHRLMAILRDGHLKKLDYLQDNGLLHSNTDAYVGSGGFGYTNELPNDVPAGKVTTQDMWGFCESQETVSVSPELFEEFVLPYQMPIMERFGLNCYGCCEPLDLRWDLLEKIPNLRRVSISPWADVQGMSEKLGDRFIYSRKPSPTDLAYQAIDQDKIRKGLRETMQITKSNNNHVEIIMKDNNTLGNNPSNATEWCRIAKEEAMSL